MKEANPPVLGLLDFIKKSPSPFHAVKNVAEQLKAAGVMSLSEGEVWNLQAGKSYFVTRNDSSLIAFSLPKEKFTSFSICASHSDSPSFKIKENPEMKGEGSLVLNVEKYGGMLIQSWFDRPLSVSGRLIVRQKSNLPTKNLVLESRLVNIDRDLLLIPNLAIHMNREANEGWKIDVQKEIRPVFAQGEDKNLSDLVAEAAGVRAEDIVSSDLFLYCRSEPCIWGARKEFVSSPRLDDLECAWTTLRGFLQSGENQGSVKVYCLFDNEEVGSASRQGADSSFLTDVIDRISEKSGLSLEEKLMALSKSLMVSADNAHAVHPNYTEKADPVNRPKINGGVVIKFNAAQKYTSDGISSAVFKEICSGANLPFQVFTNNSNVAGGSTLGNISQTHLSIPSVDIGLAQWAMHSSYESAGCQDVETMIGAVKNFYQTPFRLN